MSPGSWSQDEEFMCPKTEIQSHSLWLTLGTFAKQKCNGWLTRVAESGCDQESVVL